MRTLRSAGLALVASVLAAAFLSLPASAATAVLTTGGAGGTAVPVGASLTASGPATFYTSPTGTTGIKCTASFPVTVTTNPPSPGTSTGSLTGATFSGCSSNLSGTSVSSIGLDNLPYVVSVASGLGVTVSAGTLGPVQVTMRLIFFGSPITCTYQPQNGTVTGTFSNADSTVRFTNVPFNRLAGSGTFCPSPMYFSATLAVRDGTEPVFVN